MTKETNTNSSTKAVIGPVALNYPRFFEPVSFNGSAPKYSTVAIIPKDDSETLEKINAAIEAAIEKGNFGDDENFDRSKLKLPLRDGDIEYPNDELYHNSYFISATSPIAPVVVDDLVQRVYKTRVVTAGEYAKVSIEFMPYDFKGKAGISCRLHNVQLLNESKLYELRPDPSKDFKVEKFRGEF